MCHIRSLFIAINMALYMKKVSSLELTKFWEGRFVFVLAKWFEASGKICFFSGLYWIIRRNCWRNYKARIKQTFICIIEVVGVIGDLLSILSIAGQYIWMITLVFNNSIIYWTLYTTYTKPIISSSIDK